MNAPLPDSVRRALTEVTLDDHWARSAQWQRRLTSASADVKAIENSIAGRSYKWTR